MWSLTVPQNTMTSMVSLKCCISLTAVPFSIMILCALNIRSGKLPFDYLKIRQEEEEEEEEEAYTIQTM